MQPVYAQLVVWLATNLANKSQMVYVVVMFASWPRPSKIINMSLANCFNPQLTKNLICYL